MAIKAPIELYRRSIPEGLKTKDLFFVALQDKLTVIKPNQRYREEGSCYQQRHVRLADADGKPFTSSYREVR